MMEWTTIGKVIFLFITGFLCGGVGKKLVWKMWLNKCDELTAELIWQYRVAFNADYDLNFNHELERSAADLADEVATALKNESFVLVVIHYTQINRILHLACFISIFKQSNFIKILQVIYVVIIYNYCVKILN